MKALTQSVQSIAAFVLALIILAVGAAVGLAFLGVALVIGLGTAVAVKLSGSRRRPAAAMGTQDRRRVWNDGRGPIIDL